MLGFKQARLPASLSVGTLAVFILSLLLHLLALRTISMLGGGDRTGPANTSKPPATVVVELQTPVARPVPPVPPVPPARPATKPPPKPKAKAPARKPKPRAKAPAAPAVVTPPAVASPDWTVPDQGPVEPGPAIMAQTEAEPGPDLADLINSGSLAEMAPALDQVVGPIQPIYETDPPPSAELRYAVEAIRQDGSYYGRGTIEFRSGDGRYSIRGEAKLLFFSVLEFSSAGNIDGSGLHPVKYSEKPFRRPAVDTHFDRGSGLIRFSASAATYPRHGGEQDRASIVWQLAAIGRGDRSQLQPGRELTLFVAGVRDAEPWILRVVGEETVEADGTSVMATHIERIPRAGSYQQQLDIWLAPTMQWYPVKLRFTETNGDYLELSLSDPPQLHLP